MAHPSLSSCRLVECVSVRCPFSARRGLSDGQPSGRGDEDDDVRTVIPWPPRASAQDSTWRPPFSHSRATGDTLPFFVSQIESILSTNNNRTKQKRKTPAPLLCCYWCVSLNALSLLLSLCVSVCICVFSSRLQQPSNTPRADNNNARYRRGATHLWMAASRVSSLLSKASSSETKRGK